MALTRMHRNRCRCGCANYGSGRRSGAWRHLLAHGSMIVGLTGVLLQICLLRGKWHGRWRRRAPSHNLPLQHLSRRPRRRTAPSCRHQSLASRGNRGCNNRCGLNSGRLSRGHRPGRLSYRLSAGEGILRHGHYGIRHPGIRIRLVIRRVVDINVVVDIRNVRYVRDASV